MVHVTNFDTTTPKEKPLTKREMKRLRMIERGGKGSGHHGHRGRPGEVGGSLPGEGGGFRLGLGEDYVVIPTGEVAYDDLFEFNHGDFSFEEIHYETDEGVGLDPDVAVAEASEEIKNRIRPILWDFMEDTGHVPRDIVFTDHMDAIFDEYWADYYEGEDDPAYQEKRKEVATMLYRNGTKATYTGNEDFPDNQKFIHLNVELTLDEYDFEKWAWGTADIGWLDPNEEETFRQAISHELGHWLTIEADTRVNPPEGFIGPSNDYKASNRIFDNNTALSEYQADLVASMTLGDMGFRGWGRELTSEEEADREKLMNLIDARMKTKGETVTERAKQETKPVLMLIPWGDGYEGVMVTENEIPENAEDTEFIVSRSDFMQLLKGESLMYGPLRRMISIQDGPFHVVDDGMEPTKIMPPEPIEFRTEEHEKVLERIETEIEKDEPGLTERIRDVLAGFVDRVRGVFRGGPGSGHHGHEGRPGEVGGSLPSGGTPDIDGMVDEWSRQQAELKEAETIGGKRGGFLKTLKKVKDSLTPKTTVRRNPDDPDLWFELYQAFDNHEWGNDAASGILMSILHRVDGYMPNGSFYRRIMEVSEEVDHNELFELRDKLHREWIDEYTTDFWDEVEQIVLEHYDWADPEDTRNFLAMSEDDFELLDALDPEAVHDAVLEQALTNTIESRRAELGAESIYSIGRSDESPKDIASTMVDRENWPHGASHQTDAAQRAYDWVEQWYKREIPEPKDEDIVHEYGGLPTVTGQRESSEIYPHTEGPNYPDGKHFLLGVREGVVVSAMMASEERPEHAMRGFIGGEENRERMRDLGVNYDRDIKDQTYLYIDYVASRESGMGYGTEMMMKALSLAGENGWGIAGSSTDDAAVFYDKLGAKWINEDTAFSDGGTAFWTPRDVERAYKLLNRIGAGEVMEIERAMIVRAFNILNLPDLYDPAALMARPRRDPERHGRKMREAFERYMARNHPPTEDEVIIVRGPLRRIVVEKHLGPGDHPSGSSQQAHAGGKGGKRPDKKKKGAGAAEGVRGEREQADVGAEGAEVAVAEEEGPEVSGVMIKVGDDNLMFDSQEQYETLKGLADGQYTEGQEREPELTSMFSGMASEHGGDMSGLDFAVKSPESILRKIREKMIEHDLTEEEAAKRINDVNRYTMLFTPETYVEKVKAVQSQLGEMGYSRYDNKYKNYWKGGDDYDGYNTVIENTETGQRIELQFHTYESIQIKRRSHEIYAQLRVIPESQPGVRQQLYDEMVSLWQGDYERPLNWEQLEGVVKERVSRTGSPRSADRDEVFRVFGRPSLRLNLHATIITLSI
jgi:hypothetical protein